MRHRFLVQAQGEIWQEPRSQRGASMPETAAPPSGIARDCGTVETTVTTTFRGPSSLASMKASGDSAQGPSLEENKMKKSRTKVRLEVVAEGDACAMTARMLGLATSLRRAAEILDQAHSEAGEGSN